LKISTQIRYGVRALCDIAYNFSGSPTQVKAISEREGLPPRYIEQIFQKFKRAGILKSVRGPFGGYCLAKEPSEIRVGDVIRAVEGGDIRLVFCLGEKARSKKKCDRYDMCVHRDVWDEAGKRMMEYFDSITIDHLCSEATCKAKELMEKPSK
jgi:Rrf2 family transcriptional regulator, iron-sulfur cluster assembly transcription factor